MIDNILPFPTKDVQNWTIASRSIKKAIIDAGISESIAVGFATFFKPIFESFQFEHKLSIPSSDPVIKAMIDDEIVNFQFALKQHTSKLIFERFIRELDIYING